MRRSGLAVALLAVLLGAAGCSCGEPKGSGAPPAALAADPPAPNGGEASALLPAPGRFAIESAGGRLSVLANDVPRRALLRAIAEQLDFALVDRDRRDPWVTVLAPESTLEAVLFEILPEVPYALHYETRGTGERTQVALLEVGPIGEGAESGRSDVGAGEGAGERAGESREVGRRPDPEEAALSSDERERRLQVRAERIERRRIERLAELGSDDSRTRARAVFRLEADDPRNVEALERTLHDAHPQVRMEAVRKFGFGDPKTAVPALAGTLADPNPEVVLEAVESLEFLGDRTAIRDLSPLLEHPEAQIRERAAEAIEVLEARPE